MEDKRTKEILESHLIKLSNISIDEQKENPALMIAVINAIKQTVGLLLVLNKV
jgi:hypothetical protein